MGILNIKALIVVAVVVAVVYYFMFVRWTKDKAIKVLTSREKGILDASKLEKFGDDYVIAWGKAEFKGKDDFKVDGKIFSTETGKQIGHYSKS